MSYLGTEWTPIQSGWVIRLADGSYRGAKAGGYRASHKLFAPFVSEGTAKAKLTTHYRGKGVVVRCKMMVEER